MPIFSITDSGSDATGAYFIWEISGLSNQWNFSYYNAVRLMRQSYISGSVLSPSTAYYDYSPAASCDYFYPSASLVPSNTGRYYVRSWTRLPTGATSITFYPAVIDLSGQFWGVTSNSNATVPAGTSVPAITWVPPSSRPATFSWATAKISGSTFNLTAAEWNALTDNINAVRQYKGLSAYGFTPAVSGATFTAAMYNQAVAAIKGVSGYGAYLSAVSTGGTIYATHLNYLAGELNAIP